MNTPRTLSGIIAAYVLIVPTLTFAAWWNPLTWFNNWAFLRSSDQTEVEVLETRIEELEQKLEQKSENATNHTSSTTENEVATTSIHEIDTVTETTDQTSRPTHKSAAHDVIATPSPTPAPAVSAEPLPVITNMETPTKDVCFNIEGIQQAIPHGYVEDQGVCTLFEIKDYCPNLEGVQSTVPDDRTLYAATGDCLTEDQIEEYEFNIRQNEQAEIEAANAEAHRKEVLGQIARWDTIRLEISQNNYGRDPENTDCSYVDGCPRNAFPPELAELVRKLQKEGAFNSPYTPHVINAVTTSIVEPIKDAITLEQTRLREQLYE
jgi:hypothetical protein